MFKSKIHVYSRVSHWEQTYLYRRSLWQLFPGYMVRKFGRKSMESRKTLGGGSDGDDGVGGPVPVRKLNFLRILTRIER